MEIGSANLSGLQGFQQASERITQETANIASQAVQPNVVQQSPPPSLESSVVNLTSQLHNAQANVRSVETADQVLGSIIDLRV